MTTLSPPAVNLHRRLGRRLLPLHIGVALQGFMLWAPVEKLFMSEIGFDPTAVGLAAAAYAAVVPILEVPSGILADRWSRRGVLVVASTMLAACALVGGLSHDVLSYAFCAMFLGVYFAMYSGTLDAMVYDTVLEETGGSDGFERRIGAVRAIESAALVASSLAGGWVASLLSPRTTYFLTIPLALLSVVAYLRFREPRLHRSDERTPLRKHVATTLRVLTRTRSLAPVIVLAVLSAVLMQSIFEFGPLWLVAIAAPAVLFGPYWAALMTTLGLGGLLAGRVDLDRPAVLGVVTGLLALGSVTLTVATHVVVITLAQVLLGLLLMALAVHVSLLVHNAVPSTVRAGVASGVSSLTWLVFLPFSVVFGVVSTAFGVHTAGWLLTGVALLVGALLAATALRRSAPAAAVA
ncbi:MFS transporter [Pseudonocardia sp. TRM90224]|uniref:MFS transporter n=1 Tax=Pseudonocardia sp. TRM90224 TaxID=2812678 RepID=UPI001E592411|nr:MFS transporter [Pseudonocardia sp. TRM90224]